MVTGHYPLEGFLPLPLWSWITILAAPSTMVGIPVLLYRNRDLVSMVHFSGRRALIQFDALTAAPSMLARATTT